MSASTKAFTGGVGTTATTFTVTWAAATPPTGYVFDVQIRRPGAAFVGWKTGVTSRTASFTPDAGTGTYSFRARLRNIANGATSNYSGAKSISVS